MCQFRSATQPESGYIIIGIEMRQKNKKLLIKYKAEQNRQGNANAINSTTTHIKIRRKP